MKFCGKKLWIRRFRIREKHVMNLLLGKRSAVPYLSPATATPSVKSETLSIQSSNHSSRSNTLERNRKETKSSVNAVIPSNLATLPTIPQVIFLKIIFLGTKLCLKSHLNFYVLTIISPNCFSKVEEIDYEIVEVV